MADKSIRGAARAGYPDEWSADTARTTAARSEPTHRVEAVVTALIPQYHQIKVRSDDGHSYSLTRKTKGFDLQSLHEGQRVVCTVTRRLPRVLTVAAVA